MPVIRAVEGHAGCVQCTFSANIRDAELQGMAFLIFSILFLSFLAVIIFDLFFKAPGALLASAKQEPPGELFQTLRPGRACEHSYIFI